MSEQGSRFPDGFLWGTATSAHQIEGENRYNDWWYYEQAGHPKLAEPSEKACNSYELYLKDNELIAELGYTAYRLSIEWSRIFPKEGEKNQAAIEHYRELLLDLKAKGITAFVTLHHFTSPLWFMERGGFLKRSNLKYFREFVKVVVSELGELIEFWNTINEPNVYATSSYFGGEFPPFQASMRKYIVVIRNLLRAHAIAYEEIKRMNSEDKVGIVKNIPYFKPLHANSLRERLISRFFNYAFNTVTLRALRTGKLPFGVFKHRGLKGSFDFLGINYYSKAIISNDFKDGVGFAEPDAERVTLMGWEPYPEGLLAALRMGHEWLHCPIYVTENGIATEDDQWRIQYIQEHLEQVKAAIDEGIDCRGYFYWSLLDNFEWTMGYAPTFGLIAVQRDTFERTIKESAKWYGKVARENKLI